MENLIMSLAEPAGHLLDFCAVPGIYLSTLKIIDHQLCVT
jgi:hypothetical protein